MQQRSEKKGSEEAPFSDPFFVFIVLNGVLGEVFDPQVKQGRVTQREIGSFTGSPLRHLTVFQIQRSIPIPCVAS
jgi:hypothetical protein